jgi:hypothetical protein
MHFKQLQGQQQGQHGNACIAPKERPEAGEHAGHGKHGNRQQQPARRHPIASEGHPAAPEQQRGAYRRYPCRQVADMRQQHEGA